MLDTAHCARWYADHGATELAYWINIQKIPDSIPAAWRIDPLLSSDCKQRPSLGNGSVNTFPLLGSRFLIMQQLDYNNGNGVFLRGPCRDIISKGQSQLLRVQFNSTRKALKRGPERVKLKNFHC
jgi:hypothetical protein